MNILAVCKRSAPTCLGFIALIIGLPLAAAGADKATGYDHKRLITEVLNEIAEEYRIFFTYEAEILKDIEVDFELREGESMEQSISRLLADTNLGYKTFGEKYVVIYQNTRGGQKKARRFAYRIKQLQRLEASKSLSVHPLSSKPEQLLGSVAKSAVEMEAEKTITNRQKKMKMAEEFGVVQGIIRDELSGEPIAYASVQLMGTSNGAISDNDGFYSLQHVRPGTHQLKISYVGYANMEKTVEVIAGQVTTMDVQLSFTPIRGEEAVVTAMAQGQARAINTQLAARTIKNVVSEQKIRELPDANVAEALSRLPGVSVVREGGEAVEIKVRGVASNTVFVNGMRLDGELGSISSSMIGGIELIKAFMPDRDADVLGGNVEFKMREAKPGFNKDIWVRTGYNGFTNSFKMQDISALISNRFFDDRLGVMLSLSYDRKDRGRDVASAGYETIGSSPGGSEDIKPVKINGYTLNRFENLNKRYGTSLYADYRLKSGKLYYQAFYSQFNSDNFKFSNSYSSNSVWATYSSVRNQRFDANFLQGLGGEHTILGANVEWGISMSNRKNNTPDQLGYDAVNMEAMSTSIDVDSTTTIVELLDLLDHDIEKTAASGISRSNIEEYSRELAARLDFEVPFKIGTQLDGYLKFGGKYRNMSRGYDYFLKRSSFLSISGDQIYNDVLERLPDYGWEFTDNGFIKHEAFATEPFEQDFSMFDTKLYYAPDWEKVQYVVSEVDDLLNQIMKFEANDFTNKEHYYAGYIMSGIDFGKIITFTPGIRYEKFEYTTTAKFLVQTAGYGPFATQGELKDTTNGHFNEQFFPMFHLKIKPVDWFDIRLAATKTATRPHFQALSPKYNRTMGGNLFVGDVFLRPQINYNYDIYLSFYSGKAGLFTAGAFYKKLEDQILEYMVTVVDNEEYGLPESFVGMRYHFPQNNQWPGYVKGLEFDWQTHFSFLPKPFRGIVLNMNITFMQSETRYPFYSFYTITIPEPPYREAVGQHDSRINTVIGMPDMIGNVTLGYELGGFAGRISAYYQSATITEATAANKSLDRDKDELMRLDMQLSQKIRKVPGLIFYLNINNITNNPDRMILTYHRDRVVREERYGVSGDIGVRYKF
ncbi:MAG: carboxypeptidase-like regulatory domain-containing protein [Bacteroidota bacterium]